MVTLPPQPVLGAPDGMVAAAQPRAVEVGVELLKRGGSAVDAAIGVNACLCVMEPTSCGLGGDLFALVWEPSAGALAGLNASGRAPRTLTIELVRPDRDGTIPLYSPYAWTVPGCVDGWFQLHGRFGRLPMREILAPAIARAKEGFSVTPIIAEAWAMATAFADKPGFREVFLPEGRAPKSGETFRNPALGNTLQCLAEEGREAFYRGRIVRTMLAYSERHGGHFSQEDFDAHESTWDPPLSTTYRGHTVWEMPPANQGLAVLQILNIIEGFDVAPLGRESADFWHLLIEAKKLAFSDRARYYADPQFAKVPVEALLSKTYAKRRAAKINMRRASDTEPPGNPEALNRAETTYLCTADRWGMMVSLIQSNYTGFGSGFVIPDLGFGLQNRGALFSLQAEHPNRLEPGKRPFHTIIPGFLTKDGQPLMAFGVMGGDMQPQGHVQILVNLLDLGMGLQEAGDAPRFHHTGSSEPTGTMMQDGGTLYLEPEVPRTIVEALRRLGHRIKAAPPWFFGGYQAIWRDPGAYTGASERRKDGCAMGYERHLEVPPHTC